MAISGVLQTIFNVDYVLTPIAADNFVMDSSFAVSYTHLSHIQDELLASRIE